LYEEFSSSNVGKEIQIRNISEMLNPNGDFNDFGIQLITCCSCWVLVNVAGKKRIAYLF